MEWLETLPPTVLVPAAIIVVGWFVTRLLDRFQVRSQRREKTRDFLTALDAEIRDYVWTLEEADLNSFKRNMVNQIVNARRNTKFVPFVPMEKYDTVFNALVNEIHILPKEAIDPVVAHYSQLKSIQSLIEDMRSESFSKLPRQRIAAVYSDFIDMKVMSLVLAKGANREIKVQLRKLNIDLVTGKWT